MENKKGEYKNNVYDILEDDCKLLYFNKYKLRVV